MSLDFYLEYEDEISGERVEAFSANITHNLSRMADEAGIYYCLWRPEEVGIKKANELIEPLTVAVKMMKDNPERFEAFNAKNGWGLYEHFLPWIEDVIWACKKYPNALVRASR